MRDPAVRMPTLVVIPAFNEEECVAGVISDVRSAGYDCLVVDDASADQTMKVAREAGASVVRHSVNLGVGGALRTAFRFAVEHGYTQVVQVDADGQHPTGQIDRLVGRAVSTDADMVVGSRFATGDDHYPISRVRRWCIQILARRVRRAGTSLTDPTSGFRVIREPLLSEFARSFPAHYLGDTFEAALVATRRGYRIDEVGVDMRLRQGGRPSADLAALVRSMIRSVAVTLTGPSFDIDQRTRTEGTVRL